MPRADSSLNMLVIAAVIALGVGYFVPQTFSQKPADAGKGEGRKAVETWAASAPGRVEPRGGEIRISSQVPGRIAEVLVAVNDKVMAGDLMVRLADEELIARARAARAEVAARQRDRDNEKANSAAQERRTAEDNVAKAERQFALAREELDRTLRGHRGGKTTVADLDKARAAAVKAKEEIERTSGILRTEMADGAPAHTRIEAALAGARAQLSLAEAALERTRIRAPSNGTILQLNARVGETVAPSPENLLVVMGDVTSLRVRAEFEERDLGKLRLGQGAVVRSDAFPGKDFEGTVSSLARALGPSRLGPRGPRRPTDIDVLEVIIDLTGQPPLLLPGMRVDVFLKAALPRPPTAAVSGGSRRT